VGKRAANKPFLKWAGNKFRIIDRIQNVLPQGQRLVEPFAGSGAVFLNTEFEEYLVCDSNADLIGLFNTLKAEGSPFIEACAELFDGRHNNADRFYELRERFNQSQDITERAQLFVYLNRHGYNGLCRYNSKGGFNVPFGRYKRPYFPAREMEAFHQQAQRARFVQQDFEHTFTQLQAGDVVYCDPPYVPLSESANFTSYSSGGFSDAQQQRLAQLAQQVSQQQAVPVIISNHNTRETRAYYQGADIKGFRVQRFISRDGKNRSPARELLARFRAPDFS